MNDLILEWYRHGLSVGLGFVAGLVFAYLVMEMK